MGLRCLTEFQRRSEYRPVGLDGPGVPFSGYPVFPASPRDEQVSVRRSSRRLALPCRAETREPSAVELVEAPRLAPTHPGSRQQPSWALVLYSAYGRESPQQRGYQVPPEPALGVSTPTANRAARAILSTRRVCFTPATLLSFRLQGLEPPEEEAASPRPFLPCRLAPHSGDVYDCEGLNPSGSRTEAAETTAIPCPHGVIPSEAIPPAAVGAGFPAPSSHALGTERSNRRRRHSRSRDTHEGRHPDPAPQSLTEQRARLRGTQSPKAPRPKPEGFDSRIRRSRRPVPAPLGFRTLSRSNPKA
jgi:hypothetical protein